MTLFGAKIKIKDTQLASDFQQMLYKVNAKFSVNCTKEYWVFTIKGQKKLEVMQ